MAFFHWNTRLETGNSRVDEQHKRLFSLTNRISEAVGGQAPLPEVSDLVAELVEYAQVHFSDEEKLMATSSLPFEAQGRHIAAHRNFIERVGVIAAKTDLSQTQATGEFLDFLVNWLVTHILKMDHQMALTLPERNPSPDRSPQPAISVEKVLISALGETERRFRLLAEQAPVMIWLCGLSGTREFVNKGWHDFIGIPAEGPDPIDWLSFIHPEDREPYRVFLSILLDHGTPGEREYRVRNASGGWTWILERVVPRMEEGICVGLLAAAIDISAIKSVNEFLEREVAERTRQLEVLAGTDALTGLLNRRSLDVRLASEIGRAQRYCRPLSILFIDIDHFKRINDDFGHAAGDSTLVAIAEAIKGRLRDTDHVVRLGGEEFVAILVETDLPQATLIADTLRRLVMSLTFTAVPKPVTISVGVTELQRNDDVGSLIARADGALLEAKRGGRNRCRVAALELST